MLHSSYLILVSFFLFITATLSSCSNSNSKQLIQHHFNSLIKHDIKQVTADYDPKVQVTSSGWEGIHNGISEVGTTWKRYFRSTPDLRFDIGNVYFSSDSIAVVEYTQSGTLSTPEPGEPAYMIGKKYLLNTCTIFTFRNNKIVTESTYFDQLSFLRQIGFFDHR